MRGRVAAMTTLSSVVLAGSLWFGLSGRELYYNIGVSLRPGWYVCQPLLVSQSLRRGDLLQLRPSVEARQVMEHLAPHEPRTPLWMKQLAAVEGETVCLRGDTVTMQDMVIGHRPLLQRYPLAPVEGCWTLGPDDVFVLGTHPQSYDSRYTGPWARRAVQGTCRSLWTWEAQP
jgi:type IV secretory pathway protease TraF